MKKNWKIIAAIAAAIAVIALSAWFLSERHENHSWDVLADASDTETFASEPFGMNRFDEYLSRTLDNGYSVQIIDVDDLYEEKGGWEDDIYYEDCYSLRSIIFADKDTTLMVVQSYGWVLGSDVYPAEDLFDFASSGGQAVYVFNTYHCSYGPMSNGLEDILPENPYYDISICSDDYSDEAYSPLWYKKRVDSPIYTKTEGKYGPKLRTRFTDLYFKNNLPPSQFKNLRYKDERVHLREILHDHAFYDTVYAIEFYFPRTGGKIIMTGLTAYFHNIGLTIPDGPEVVAHLMSRVDDRPVKRISAPEPRFYSEPHSPGSSNNSFYSYSILDHLKYNPALHFAWILLLIFSGCLLVRGLMRRYPTTRHADADYLDPTDMVAEREYKFRKSPLLHFLFQCSWLYKGKREYTDLFRTNFRRLASVVNRFANIELASADDDQLAKAARILARRQDLDEAEVLDDLKWMQAINQVKDREINSDEFAYSQYIVEKYPFIA